jgi:hypothetical protein
MTIPELIDKSVQRWSAFGRGREFIRVQPPYPLGSGVPTLAKGVYRPFSPQLKARFEHIGRWQFATHGDWLGLDDMERLWSPESQDVWTKAVNLSRIAVEENWANDAAALFRPDRLTLFSCDLDCRERIYLLWLDWADEPELWVYDGNGELRFVDLCEYLTVFVTGDTSHCSRPWRLQRP